jgi:hypothetical protein
MAGTVKFTNLGRKMQEGIRKVWKLTRMLIRVISRTGTKRDYKKDMH